MRFWRHPVKPALKQIPSSAVSHSFLVLTFLVLSNGFRVLVPPDPAREPESERFQDRRQDAQQGTHSGGKESQMPSAIAVSMGPAHLAASSLAATTSPNATW